MAEKPILHGRDHRAGGDDPIRCDWIEVGTSGAPAFKNSWANVGGTYVPLRFRFLPHIDSASFASGGPGIGVEIQGSVTGGAAGTVIFTLPITFDYVLHLPVSDELGAFTVLTVKQNGDVTDGFV